MPLRCLIVDDNEQFLRAATSSLGRDGLEIVGTATTPEAALDQVARLRPDLVLVDVGLGQASGFDLTVRLVNDFPYLESRVVLISTHAIDDLGDLLEQSPAVGFISKTELSSRSVHERVSPIGDR